MTRFRTSIAAAAAVALAACSDEDAARLTIRLTDAAADLRAAVVTIDRIALHGDGREVVLADERATVDLLSLANETVALVEDAVVPAGRYEQLRFRISGGYVEVPDASGEGSVIFASSPSYEGLPRGALVTGELKMPSFEQSGLKVTLPGDALVVRAGSRILLVDFDVSQSFGHEAGGSGSWVMHPVLKGADLELSGNVIATLALGTAVTLPTVGSTRIGLGDFEAVLAVLEDGEVVGEERLRFADDGTGTFAAAAFRYLFPGSYTVAVSGPPGVTFATSPAGPAPVAVLEGEDVMVPFTITSASTP